VPHYGADAYRKMEEGMGWHDRVALAVQSAAKRNGTEPMALCREVVAILGLPPYAVNPLVARSLTAHLT
jgi:hypothetical protein